MLRPGEGRGALLLICNWRTTPDLILARYP
jgi:hypothetical protein